MRRLKRPFGAALLFLPLSLALAACQEKETGPDDAATASAPQVAPSPPPVSTVPPSAHPLGDFATLDADHDGQLTSAEYAQAAQALFMMMDVEHDGNLSGGELDAGHNALGDLDGLAPAQVLRIADADHDGKLTLAEWIAFNNARFDRIDANDDGVIDKAEWDAPHPAPTMGQ